MNCYLMLRDPAPAANISMEPHLHEIVRGADGCFRMAFDEDGEEIDPHALAAAVREAMPAARRMVEEAKR